MDEQQPSTSYGDRGSGSENDSSDENEASMQDKLTEDYENELETNLEHKPKPKKSRHRHISKIPAHLKGLMGEANLRFARGDHETAEKMCYEVIRQEPRAYEPYVTLAQLFETSHIEKCLQYLTIAAHLNPTNVDHWLRLAQIYIERKNFKTAVGCYTRAIVAEPNSVELHDKRICLLEILDDKKFVLRCKVKLLQILDADNYMLIMDSAKELAQIFFKQNEYDKALDVLKVAMKKCSQHFTLEMVNIYLELLLAKQEYSQCLDIFVQYCNIEIEVMLDDDKQITILSYNLPNVIPVDLRIKFIICLIKLKAFRFIDDLLAPLLNDEENVEKIGDLYLDLAEALMSMERYDDALVLLVPLIKSVNFSLAAVWLKYAECLMHCKMISQAIDAYYKVVQLAPQHNDVRYPLSELLLKEDRITETLDVLAQDCEVEVDVGLLLKRMEILLRLNRIDEYFDSVELLLKRHCIIPTHQNEVVLLFLSKPVNHKLQRVNHLREIRGEPPMSLNLVSLHEPSVEAEYEIYLSILKFCYKNGYYQQLKRFAFYGLGSARFKQYTNDITVVALYGCIFTRDHNNASPILRDYMLRKSANNNLIWNLLNLAQLQRHRFVMRHMKIESAEGANMLKMFEAINAFPNGSNKIICICLMPLLKMQPTPYVHFLLGIVFLQISFQKFRDIRKKITQCAYGLFANYAHNRGKAATQEVYYNLGRLYHQYGILEIASHYYQQVLNYKSPLIEQYPDLDLKQEAAFNLIMIYKSCGNFTSARTLMRNYLVVE